MTSGSRFLFCAAIAILSLPMTHASRAEDYPARPIKLLVGAPAGGTTDTIARAIAEPMAVALKQPVLVENRPGAGGNLAAAAVTKSTPDGYTLLVSFSSHTINATLYPNLPYDPVADFTPITMVARVTSLLVGRADLPAKDLKALIELARAKPHTLTIGIGGIGSSLHLAGEKFKQMTGVDLLNVPYKGTAPALTDLLGGQIGASDQQTRHPCHHGDRREISDSIVGQGRIQCRVDRVAAEAHQQCVPVGRRLGDRGRSQIATGSRPVFDQNRLLQGGCHRFCNGTRDCIRGATSRSAHQ